jgi:HEPN domain-containing protein
MTQPIDRARRLLVLAERDIISFRALSSHPEVDISATGFFAQQVVEKCLKAVAEYHGIVFRRTHDVDELVDLLLQHQVPCNSVAKMRASCFVASTSASCVRYGVSPFGTGIFK